MRSRSSSRIGEKRCGHSSSSEDDRDRLLEVRPARVGQRPDRTGGVDDVGVAEQDERVEPLLAHDGPEPFHSLTVHSSEVRRRRDPRRRRGCHQPRGHQSSSPR